MEQLSANVLIVELVGAVEIISQGKGHYVLHVLARALSPIWAPNTRIRIWVIMCLFVTPFQHTRDIMCAAALDTTRLRLLRSDDVLDHGGTMVQHRPADLDSRKGWMGWEQLIHGLRLRHLPIH